MLLKLGYISFTLGLILLTFIYWPVAKVEIDYLSKSKPADLIPVNTDFGIVIPKIGANAKVVAKVDPFNNQEYQRALALGVAHAKTSRLPGESGNIFIFSHSSANFYEAGRYNSIFYLLNKLEPDDEIRLYYLGQEYRYLVESSRIVNSEAINFLTDKQDQLTLMTCWPPGTSYKRLLVIAKQVN